MPREITPVVPTHVPLPSTPPHHRLRGCVCVCVCVCVFVCNGFLFVFIIYCICPLLCYKSTLEFTATPSFILIYANTTSTSAIRRFIYHAPTCFRPLVYSVVSSTHWPHGCIYSVSLAYIFLILSTVQAVPSLPHPPDQVSVNIYISLYLALWRRRVLDLTIASVILSLIKPHISEYSHFNLLISSKARRHCAATTSVQGIPSTQYTIGEK